MLISYLLASLLVACWWFISRLVVLCLLIISDSSLVYLNTFLIVCVVYTVLDSTQFLVSFCINV